MWIWLTCHCVRLNSHFKINRCMTHDNFQQINYAFKSVNSKISYTLRGVKPIQMELAQPRVQYSTSTGPGICTCRQCFKHSLTQTALALVKPHCIWHFSWQEADWAWAKVTERTVIITTIRTNLLMELPSITELIASLDILCYFKISTLSWFFTVLALLSCLLFVIEGKISILSTM